MRGRSMTRLSGHPRRSRRDQQPGSTTRTHHRCRSYVEPAVLALSSMETFLRQRRALRTEEGVHWG